MQRFSLFQLILIFLGGFVLLFIVAPLLGLLIDSTPSDIYRTAGNSEVQRSIVLTIWTSMAATVIFALGAIPMAYILARREFYFKRLVLGIINLPIVIPHSAAGIAILGFVSRDTLLGKLAESIGFNFISTPAGIIIAMAFVSIPFLLNAAMDGFLSVPVRLEKAALNLGASPVRVFFTISLPLAWRNILTGLIMMFARGMSEFGAVVIIAYHPMISPVMIFEWFGAFGLKYARPVAVIFIAVSLVFFILLRLLSREKEHAGT